MKRIATLLFSSSTAIFLLLVLMFAMGTATFIEDRYDTFTAQRFVYHAAWFELIFFLLILNLFGHISKHKMLSRKKWASLLFHVAFIVIIIGAGITRYFGFEGSMHIREGEQTNLIYTQDPYLQISIEEKNQKFNYDKPFSISSFAENSLHLEYTSGDKGKITIDYVAFINNAVEKVRENVPGGRKIISLVVANESVQQNLFLADGQVSDFGMLSLAFNTSKNAGAVQISENNGVLTFTAPIEIIRTNMETKQSDTVRPGTPTVLLQNIVYRSQGNAFMKIGYYTSAATEYVPGASGEKGNDALVVNVTVQNKSHKATILGGPGYVMSLRDFNFDGVAVKMGYGEKTLELPFSIRLNDFILDRYAGSMSPSSYASEVTLIDNRKNLQENHRIFMNNVLDYNMYRFFQSSYDPDEKGTVLSVNHDFYGTLVTYAGYFLLSLGFILSLFSKNSRFHELSRKIGEIRLKRKAGVMMTGLFILFSAFAFSQTNTTKPVAPDQAEKFGHLLVQTYDGRFEPIHSMAYDVMHKIARKDKFEIAGKGKMDAIQVVMDMMMFPGFWKEQKIIYVREKPVQQIIGITGNYASFLDFFDGNRQYKLQKYIEEAFRKKQSTQNSFDKEIIKVDERLNIFQMTINGSMLKLFPEQGAANNKWVSWDEKAAMVPLTGQVAVISGPLHLNPLTYSNIMTVYLTEVIKGITSGDYTNAGKIQDIIIDIQRNSPGKQLLASETKINVEILYNKLQIFIVLRNIYALLSVILLLLAFTDNLRPKKSRIISVALNISILVLGLAFLYHTFGMILRWYLTGHAPWSNGYESLILIAWGGLLAGFSFARYSKITLAATALLAFFILMTASHSSYDPQLTNLQPVLKSYWLIIHVATLTISYGFLGLGFILGLMNLVIFLFKTTKNNARLDLIISELTCINEMNLIVGIVLATIGTFLGGVWANESWGRYWGWDAKETWALVIVIAYTLVLHLRFIPKLRSSYVFNVASVAGFGSVIMTFVGVNYYLSKGMHSYGAGDTPVFPLWAWGLIFSIISLIVIAGLKQSGMSKQLPLPKSG
ncbi:MAG: cytochrome c biogenesis protein CcsA [Bacteroidetes bacterium]|nr:cytochrome c biogenesis protein CcsA [Bacteroidota bacterium]